MICLGIEGTAHTFGLALVDDKGKILLDIRDSYKTKHGGIIPSEAAKHHKNIKKDLIEKVLKLNKKIDLIAFSNAPGLSPCLLVAMETAKELSLKLNVPLIGVNHCIAHLTSGLLFTKAKDPIYVYVSGANTQIIALEDKYRIFGECLDIGLGNALDKFGRAAGLGFPCGPKIEELAKKGSYIDLPYTVKGTDLVYSGIITKAVNLLKKESLEDLCYSLQETLFSMLVEVTERALAHSGKKEVLLIGGVAANTRLKNMLKIMCKERNSKFYYVPLKYSGDNAVMIAWQGILEKNRKMGKIDIFPYQRTDEVEVFW